MAGMNRRHAVTAAVTVVAVAILAAIIVNQVSNGPDAVDPADAAGAVVRPDSHRLDDVPGAKATLVEFLDFECESCRAAYPFIEEVRERYEGRLTFVIRYFPLDGHANARNAAHAVEAAARQGELEAMYSRMYETQAEWGEQQQSQARLFRSFADDLGLDMDRYDTDVVSDEVADRVERDFVDGRALGVSGTPTFFLDGEKLQPATTQEFVAAIDAALAS